MLFRNCLRLFLGISLIFLSAITLVFAKEQGKSNPYHEALPNRDEAVFSPLSESISSFGELTIDKNGIIKWGSGQKAKFEVEKFDKSGAVVKLIKEPPLKLNGKSYRFLKFSLMEMDDLEISLYRAMYVVNFCQTEKDLESDDTLWGVYLLKE